MRASRQPNGVAVFGTSSACGRGCRSTGRERRLSVCPGRLRSHATFGARSTTQGSGPHVAGQTPDACAALKPPGRRPGGSGFSSHHAHRTSAGVQARPAGHTTHRATSPTDTRTSGRAAPIAAFTRESHAVARRSHIRHGAGGGRCGCARRRAPRPRAGRRREHQRLGPGAAARARRDAAGARHAPVGSRRTPGRPCSRQPSTQRPPRTSCTSRCRRVASPRPRSGPARADGRRAPGRCSAAMRAVTRSAAGRRSASARSSWLSGTATANSASCAPDGRARRTCRRRRACSADEMRLAALRVGPHPRRAQLPLPRRAGRATRPRVDAEPPEDGQRAHRQARRSARSRWRGPRHPGRVRRRTHRPWRGPQARARRRCARRPRALVSSSGAGQTHLDARDARERIGDADPQLARQEVGRHVADRRRGSHRLRARARRPSRCPRRRAPRRAARARPRPRS